MATMAAGWFRREGPAVKYISSAPGTRTLTLPCPFAEIAPLATTRWAMSATCTASSLSMTNFPLVTYAERLLSGNLTAQRWPRQSTRATAQGRPASPPMLVLNHAPGRAVPYVSDADHQLRRGSPGHRDRTSVRQGAASEHGPGPSGYDAELRLHNEVLRQACGVQIHDRVLDIGCGTGQTTRQAARTAQAGSALGVDISAPAIERARELARAEGLRNVTFEHANA